MKKLIALLLVAVLSIGLVACGSATDDAKTSPEQQASIERIEKAQTAINSLHELTDYSPSDFSTIDEYSDHVSASFKEFLDTLYLTADAEIHHNTWTQAYLSALEAYNALSSDEKLEIKNVEWLSENKTHIEQYEKILIEQEIALFCKDAAVEALKETLVNKSSYEEYGWVLEKSYYWLDYHTFTVELKIEYSATNRMGGRIDDVEYVRCEGTYTNGEISIISIT